MSTLDGRCYLCGLEVLDNPSADHVPMKQIFAKSLRRATNPNLVTLPVHAACNGAYQHDEDYFTAALLPAACDTTAGNGVLADVAERKRKGEWPGLIQKVFDEVALRPSGLFLPRGKVVKRLEGQRILRVAWKITRGLYSVETGEYLPDTTPRSIEIVSPGDKPPDAFFALQEQPNRGLYPGVFDYRWLEVPDLNRFNLWSFLLWDKIIFVCGFHHPSCPCTTCTTRGAN